MIFTKLILKNFLTYENLEYEFEKKPLLVQGLNLTDARQKTNGSGKSGMQTGIEFCITASNSRDVRDRELVRFGQKEANAQLFVYCGQRKETLHIDWIIKTKGSNILTLKKRTDSSDWEDVSFSNVNDGKKYILDWFAISKEDLFNYFIINKTRFKSFFKSSNREKVELINRFSDASIIEGLEKIDNEELQVEYDNLKSKISALDGKIEVTSERITQEKNRDFEEELKEESSIIDGKILQVEAEISDCDTLIKNYNASILDIPNKIQEILKEKSTLEDTKEKEKQDLKKRESLLSEIKKELDKAKALSNDFKTTDWDSQRGVLIAGIEKERALQVKNEKKLEELQEKKTQVLKFLQSISIKLDGAITCPKCSHTFVLDGDIKDLKEKQVQGKKLESQIKNLSSSTEESISSIKKSISQIEISVSNVNKRESEENSKKNELLTEVNNISSKINLAEGSINSIKAKISEIEADIEDCGTEISEIEWEKTKLESQIESTRENISTKKDKIKNLKKEKLSLKKSDNSNIIKELKSDIKKFEKEKSEKNIELIKVGDKIYERNQWITNFKQFKMFLANQSLEVIQYHCNRYLSQMGSDLLVKIDGFKLLANGTIKDEITAKIIRGEKRSFPSFSGGEQGRLLFASILANRHMINSSHKYGGLDFLSVDEVFEGVDSIGLRYIVEAGKQLQISMMIITHVTDEDFTEDTLTIVKEQGISRIKK